MNAPGFSRERERFPKLEQVTEVASEMAALSLSSPAFAVIIAAAPRLSAAHCPFTDAFNIVGGEKKREKWRLRWREMLVDKRK